MRKLLYLIMASASFAAVGEISAAPGSPNVRKKSTILDSSNILVSNGEWTIIPKGAILYTPDHLKSKFSNAPAEKFLKWSDFLSKNRSWLKTEPVTRSQITGAEPIDPLKKEQFELQRVIVVSVYQQKPASINQKQEN